VYKDILNDPDKAIIAGLKVLNKVPVFAEFMKKNSFLSSVFTVPDDYNMSNSLAGMQTRSMLNQMIQNQISSGGPNALSAFQQSFGAAQGELEQLKNKLSSLGRGGADADLPKSFKPSMTKTKSFLQRLELGANLQTTKSTSFFPVTTDLGFSIAYKVSDKNVCGLGTSLKVGWGSDIRHIAVSGQGIALRSFTDLNIRNNLFVSAGFEYNYQKPFNSLNITQHLDSWQKSGLVGVSRITSLKTKTFKKAKIQLLWDYLSYFQVPRAQPFKFRVGYLWR
jgi:hypothetical protein